MSIKDENKKFLIPGILPAYLDVMEAFKDFRSHYDKQRMPIVLFRIEYTSDYHSTNFLFLNSKISLTPNKGLVLFSVPQFYIEYYVLLETME